VVEWKNRIGYFAIIRSVLSGDIPHEKFQCRKFPFSAALPDNARMIIDQFF
jgi:hypothetical protein